MGGKNVRAKKSRRKATIKITKGARKKLKKPTIKDSTLQKHWDKSKTLHNNLKDLGLAYDSNAAIKINTGKKTKHSDVVKDTNKMEIDETLNKPVIKEFERQAANGMKMERHIAPGEAKFLMTLIKKHGTNYKAMAKDKDNTYQHTAKQLKRKCESLLKSSLLTKYQSMFPELTTSAEEMDTV
ncbi:nucleolar protein 16 [Hydra vulgaris]|nr:nucleolar protein 16 [Hydra vulgaris]